MRRLAGHILVLAAAALTCGCTLMQQEGASSRRDDSAATARIHGGTRAQRALLRAIIGRMPPPPFAR
jgi:hypothetical protein